MRRTCLTLVTLAACRTAGVSTGPGPSPAIADDPPAAAAPAAPVSAEVDAPQSAGPAPVADDPAAAVVGPPELVPTKQWPFHEWDNARAYAFNLQAYGPGATLRVYAEPHGWNSTVALEKEITAGHAEQAIELLGQTKGEMLVSKCAFPRHAIVLFAGPQPVASINVCFSCGDILIWPPFDPAPDWTDRKAKMMAKLMKLYDRAYPKWEALFGKELGMPTDWKAIPVKTTGRR